MAYTPTLWAKGDKVTSEKLNKIEQGIVDKVDKETGKTLSTNDFTDAYKTKLEGIEANADKTTIDATLTNSGVAADAKATGDAIKDIENDLDGKVAIIESDLDEKVENLKSLVGTPLKAPTASDMTDTSKIYVYTGNESGYTNGDWYYHDGSAWVDGGTYNSIAVGVDDTLTVSGMPADAKVVGDEISIIKEDLNELDDRVEELEAGGTGGLSMAAVNLLNTILSEAVYGTDQTANIELLYKALSDIKPVSITAVLTSRALVGLAYSDLEFEITATFDDDSTITVDNGYRVLTSGNIVSGSNTVTVSWRGVPTTVTFTAEQVTTYTVTYNLTDVTSSNMTALVVEDDYYSTTLSVGDDYAFDGCTVTMGGVDITESAFGNMEIFIPSVTADVVIAASSTEIVYLSDFRRTAQSPNSKSFGYSDYFETQNYRLNYNGVSIVSEYPAKNNCLLEWKITNKTDTSISIAGTAIGCIPIDDNSYAVDGNFRMAYCQLVTNSTNTLDSWASISGTYNLQKGYQLAYVVDQNVIDALEIKFSGNYVADDFSEYTHLEILENTTFGAYREVKWYADDNQTLLCNASSNKFAIIDNSIEQGRYDVVFALRVSDPTALSNLARKLAIGVTADNTATTIPYSVGLTKNNVFTPYNIWNKGILVVEGNNMTIIAPPLQNTETIIIDLYIKEVSA